MYDLTLGLGVTAGPYWDEISGNTAAVIAVPIDVSVDVATLAGPPHSIGEKPIRFSIGAHIEMPIYIGAGPDTSFDSGLRLAFGDNIFEMFLASGYSLALSSAFDPVGNGFFLNSGIQFDPAAFFGKYQPIHFFTSCEFHAYEEQDYVASISLLMGALLFLDFLWNTERYAF